LIDRLWGTEEVVRALFPRLADDAALVAYIAALQRHSMSPGAAAAAERWSHEIDVRDALPSIRVPTLILHRRDDNPRFDRYFADHIPGAQLVSLPGWEHIPYLGDQDSVTREIERFVRGLGANGPAFDRVLSTVAVVAAAPADRRRAMAGEARRLLEHLVVRYRGRSIPASPRQVAAMFDGPARAAACALAMIEAGGASLGLRGGVHTGEVDVSGPAVRGPAMEAALAIARLAAPGEVLASQMVRDLATGSGLSFTAVDPPEAEGTPDAWHGYRVTGTLVGAPTHAGTTSDVAVGVPHRRAPFGHDALTAREREVLVLVASGHSDGEIAAALFISRKTASVHVSHVKAKLGANSRVELALMARGMRVRDAGRDSCDHI
jgi:DNA-binding CsgD family transcriptional regulator/class 3 adenylate cyclase